ncbi:hypothetical protein ACOMHN_026028 [Nucella lapillus]
MLRREIIHSLVALATLFTSASAVPMGPFSPGLMGFGGGLHGALGNRNMEPPFIGASYSGTNFNGNINGGVLFQSSTSMLTTMLFGTQKTLDQQGNVVSGMAVTIKPSTNVASNTGNGVGLGFGALWGVGKGTGLFGGVFFGGLNQGFMGGGGPLGQPPQELEAFIEVLVPANTPMAKALIVFTEAAPTKSGDCPAGPVLTRPVNSNNNPNGLGIFGGFGGLGGYAGASSMLGGYGPHVGGGSALGFGGSSRPDFGVIGEINIQPGINTFTVQSLGSFTDIRQLAGRGVSLCSNVQIGPDSRPRCTGQIFYCALLGFSFQAEGLVQPQNGQQS